MLILKINFKNRAEFKIKKAILKNKTAHKKRKK